MADIRDKLNFINETKHVLSKINLSRQVSYSWLKPAHFLCIKSALNNDTLGVLPTGYRKSLIF